MSFNTSSTQNNDIPVTSAQFPQSGTKAQETPSTGQHDAIPLTSAQVPHPGTKAHETPSAGQNTAIPLTSGQASQTGAKAQQTPSTGHTAGSDPTKQQIAQPQPHKAVREHKEQKSPSGGVGSLPGTPNEEGVARLPDERAQEKADQSLEEKKRAVKSDVTRKLSSTQTTLPSQEGADDSLGKTKGVGALPGSKDESGVALLPEERKNIGEKESVTAPSPRAEQPHEHGKTAVQDKGMIPGFIQAPEHPVKPQTRTTEEGGYPPTHGASGGVPRTVPPIPASGTKEERRDAPIIGGTDASSHGGSHAPVTGTTASHGHGGSSRATGTQGNIFGAYGGQGTGPEHHAEKHHQAAQQPHGRAQHEQPHKVSVMDKIKGEAKILQGKITRNEEDVLEGERIKGKI
ncbi:hypothetical protein BDN72DRAFT_859936 [Pluteus cervinus]|uniref:Uncharacterized protein n=1 Tax=Pluteus cervinus TaxID=181527 RepID=A0ACD3ANB6_9AGAR|nr:hypothetical protein BDN72DRAFT_859936 [Pluteus cervinus]